MNRLFVVALFSLAVIHLVFAKNSSGDYRTGALTKVPLHVGGKVSEGYKDTTTCGLELSGVHCTGGMVDDYGKWLVVDMPDGTELVMRKCAPGGAALLSCDDAQVLILTEEDGTSEFLDHFHVWWGHRYRAKDFEIKNLTMPRKVLYRIEHNLGITYVSITDPENRKNEGIYNPIKLPTRAVQGVKPTGSDEQRPTTNDQQ